MLDDGPRADAAGGQQLLDECARVFHFIFQCPAQKSAWAGAFVLSMTSFQLMPCDQ